MMRLIRRIFLLLIGSSAIRHGTLPTSADAVTAAAVTLTSAAVAWTWGVWVTVAATVGTADVKLLAITLENFTGAAAQGEVEVGTGLALAEVAVMRIQSTVGGLYFPNGTLIPAGTRIAARYRTSTGAADGVDVKLNVITGF